MRPLLAFFALAAACDVSPTAIERLERSSVEWLVTGGSPAGPSQRVLLDLVDRLDAADLTPGRLPGMDSLFVLAVRDESRFSPVDGERTRTEHRTRIEAAWSAMARGDRRAGEQGLEQARSFQTEAIVRVLGPGAPVAWLAIVTRTFERAHRMTATGTYGNSRDDASGSRLAIALTARDLLADARAALARGNGALALDYTTHAAGLVNLLLDRPPPF